MNITIHHIVNLSLIGLLLSLMQRIAKRPKKLPSWALASIVVMQCGLLFIVGLISAIAYPTDNFGRAQLMAWSVFLHMPLLLTGTAIILYKHNRTVTYACGTLTGLILLIALDALWIEPHWMDVSYVTLETEKLETPVRVAILADVQTDVPGPYETAAVQRAMNTEPDLILFAGDYIHMGRRSRSYAEEIAALNAILKEARLDAPLGVFAVRGNVDRPGDWQHIFDDLPATTSEAGDHFDLGQIHLTTLSLRESFNTAQQVSGETDFHIVMGHSPNFSLGAVEADLLIAGHTHGGQVQIPFVGPILTLSAVPRAWASGVTEIAAGKTLIVSRGIGLERGNAPRVRFLCRPELVIVDLIPR